MTNKHNNDFQEKENSDALIGEKITESAGVEAVKKADSLDGGENREGGQKVGQFGDDEFMQTDQTITQAAPGQTATSTNQGSSNA